MNKRIFAEIDRCSSCVVGRMLAMCECGIHVRSPLMAILVYLMLIFVFSHMQS